MPEDDFLSVFDLKHLVLLTMQVIKMASLALVASHTINGVACTHTEL